MPENFTQVKEKYGKIYLSKSTTDIEFNRHLYFCGSKPEVTTALRHSLEMGMIAIPSIDTAGPILRNFQYCTLDLKKH